MKRTTYPIDPTQSQVAPPQASWTKISPPRSTFATQHLINTLQTPKLTKFQKQLKQSHKYKFFKKIIKKNEWLIENSRAPCFGVNNNGVFSKSLLHTFLHSGPKRSGHGPNHDEARVSRPVSARQGNAAGTVKGNMIGKDRTDSYGNWRKGNRNAIEASTRGASH